MIEPCRIFRALTPAWRQSFLYHIIMPLEHVEENIYFLNDGIRGTTWQMGQNIQIYRIIRWWSLSREIEMCPCGGNHCHQSMGQNWSPCIPPPPLLLTHDKYMFWPLIWGYPQACLKLGCRVTQTPVVDFQINQSAQSLHDIIKRSCLKMSVTYIYKWHTYFLMKEYRLS